MNAPTGPPMSSALKAWLAIIAVFMVISAGIMVTGVVLWRDEVDARVAGQCHVITRTRDTLRGIIVFATKPADLTGLDPVRLGVVQQVNEQRLEARHKYIPLIDALACAA